VRNPELLADYVERRMAELNLSAHDIARISGLRVSVGTVRNLVNRRSRNIESDTLEALARPLQTSANYLFELAYRLIPTTEEPDELKLRIFFRDLPPERQKDAMMIFSALHREHGSKSAETIRSEIKSQTRKAA